MLGFFPLSNDWEVFFYTIHSKYCNVNLLNVAPSFISQNFGNTCSRFKSHSLLSPFSPIHHAFWHYNKPSKNSQHTHHVVIIIVIVIIIMSTLCYSITSHATLILLYHAFMSHTTRMNSFNTTCTLVATSVNLQSLECNSISPDFH